MNHPEQDPTTQPFHSCGHFTAHENPSSSLSIYHPLNNPFRARKRDRERKEPLLGGLTTNMTSVRRRGLRLFSPITRHQAHFSLFLFITPIKGWKGLVAWWMRCGEAETMGQLWAHSLQAEEKRWLKGWFVMKFTFRKMIRFLIMWKTSLGKQKSRRWLGNKEICGFSNSLFIEN